MVTILGWTAIGAMLGVPVAGFVVGLALEFLIPRPVVPPRR